MTTKGSLQEVTKQQDYIVFLGVVLDVAAEIVKKIKLGRRRIFFRVEGTDNKLYEAQARGWGNHLSRCVYDAIVNKGEKAAAAIEICAHPGDECEVIAIDDFTESSLRICAGAYERTGQYKRWQAEKERSDILYELDKGCIDDEIYQRFRKEIELFFEDRHALLEKDSIFDLESSDIDHYLRSYYRLLVDCVLYYEELDLGRERRRILDILLHLDAVRNETGTEYVLDFWNPIVLNKVNRINDAIERFCMQISNGKVSDKLLRIYKRTLLTKAQHSLRWYIEGDDRELWHAAIAPYVEKQKNDLQFQLVAKDPIYYSSYEGIGELRLGEKIVYEYNIRHNLKEKEKEIYSFSVAILGDLHDEPLHDLARYVRRKIEEKGNGARPHLEFHIYTKNEVSTYEDDCVSITMCGSPSDVLYNKSSICQVIDVNDVVFILDCIELYSQPQVLESEDYGFIKQKYAFSDYGECSARMAGDGDICNANALEELYEIITCKQCFNYYGKVGKRANNQLLYICEQEQKARGIKGSVYVYVSDLQAFQNLCTDSQYYIRTERYNQKEVGIIRYSSEPVRTLEDGGKDRILVFNMWQFVRNVAIDERNTFASDKCFNNARLDARDRFFELDKIFIGIDYGDWPNRLEIHYYCGENKAYERVAIAFIKGVLLPVMNDRSSNMFDTYIKKAMCSFFYGAAKNVNDMLFIHLFADKEGQLGKAVQAKVNDAKLVNDNINLNFKYSIKRFYDMIMKNYDISSSIYVGQFATSHIIHKSAAADRKINAKSIYGNVVKCCKNLSYDKGYLALNCAKEL